MRAVFKADGAETGDRYCVSEWWLEAGSRSRPALARGERELFYALEGTMSFLAGDEWVVASAEARPSDPGRRDPRFREP